jgi:hypothetical protein
MRWWSGPTVDAVGAQAGACKRSIELIISTRTASVLRMPYLLFR